MKQIKEWTQQVTRGLIDSVLPPGSVGPTTAIVLGNAIYLKGSWDHPFMVKNTKKKPFYCLDAGVVLHDVPYMSSSNSKQYVAVHRIQSFAMHDGLKVLKLHYSASKLRNKRKRGRGGSNNDDFTHYTMVIFLPDARDGLRGLVEKMASRPGFLCEHLPSESVRVGEFMVPMFKVSFADSDVGILRRLGLRLPFSTELADLSVMVMVEDNGSGLPLFVSQVIHKAVIEVNEEGSSYRKYVAALGIGHETMAGRKTLTIVDAFAGRSFNT
uniref:Serpin domain-containing protein n=1 Tax=Oryza punctata TaxID=4537 RepID=A0A0E0LVF9_ORYPU